MDKPEKVSPDRMLSMVEASNPGKQFAISDSGNAIGVWADRLGRYQTCLGLCIDGWWRQLEMELHVNGKPLDTYENATVPRG